ncbi:hypothetical protein [Streptomyces sp. NPDC051546]|uniref:hypothetical protein n=1 Tax=Streptomyces sp. NPDC051546 TaxID=3365655 RepID=UPI0037BAC8CE
MLSSDIISAHQRLKLAKEYALLVLALSQDNDTTVVIDSTGPSAVPADVSAALPIDECRYVLVDTGVKIAALLWSPGGAPVRNKMIYASRSALTAAELEGISRFAFVETSQEVADLLTP